MQARSASYRAYYTPSASSHLFVNDEMIQEFIPITQHPTLDHNLKASLNLRQGTGYGARDDILSLFEEVQFFLCGLTPLLLWGLDPQDVL